MKGGFRRRQPVLVRVHSECLTGDVLGSARCDCGWQLETALQRIEQAGRGDPRLPAAGRPRHRPRARSCRPTNCRTKGWIRWKRICGWDSARICAVTRACAQILRQLGADEVRLMTNNPRKVEELECYGIRVVERVPIEIPPTDLNRHYLLTKRDKLGHLLHVEH